MSGEIDLSVCKVGDVCHLRDGTTSDFKGEVGWCACHPYVAGGQSYSHTGMWDIGRESPYDIVRVTRDGVQVQPAVAEPKYLNAGPGCDKYRYRTGEKPEVGDIVRSHGQSIHGGIADDLADLAPAQEGLTVVGISHVSPEIQCGSVNASNKAVQPVTDGRG